MRVLLAGVLSLVMGGAPEVAAGASVSWSAPVLIDHQPPFSAPQSLGPVSCPSVGLCVAGDGAGIVTSSYPAGPASAWTATSFAGLPGYSGGALDGIACPSARFCAVAEFPSELLTSTDPTGGASAWKVTRVPSGLLSLACPSSKLCVGVTGLGIETSANPTGGPSAWKTVSFRQSLQLRSIACPTVRLCVAVSSDDFGGHIVTATKPLGGVRAWRVKPAPPNEGLYYSDVACPTVHLCVIASPGEVMTSTRPARVANRWRVTRAVVRENLVCPSTHLCVSISDSSVTTSTNPTGGATAWSTTQLAASTDPTPRIACRSAGLCVAVDSGNDVLSSTNPAAGAATWTRVNLGQGYSSLAGVSCASASACVAVDQGGNAVYSSDPAGPPSAWQIGPLNVAGLASISCPAGGDLCAAISSTDVVTSGTAGSPTPLSTYGIPMGLTQIACASAQLCVIGDGIGQVLGSSNPTGGASAWTTAELAPPTGCGKYGCQYSSIVGVTCPSNTFCAATDGASFWVSQNPAGGTGAWTESPLPVGTGQQLTCPSISLCVIVSGGSVETTTDPSDPTPQWNVTNLPPIQIPTILPGIGPFAPIPPLISGVSCASTSVCVAVDRQGGYAFVGDPTSGTWTATQIDYARPNPIAGPPSLTGVSCDPSGLCVAVDGLGFAITGQISG